MVEAAGDIEPMSINTLQEFQHAVRAAAPFAAGVQQQNFLPSAVIVWLSCV
jgi:hypothetical protein